MQELSDPECANFLADIFAWAKMNKRGWSNTGNVGFASLRASIKGHKAKFGTPPGGSHKDAVASTTQPSSAQNSAIHLWSRVKGGKPFIRHLCANIDESKRKVAQYSDPLSRIPALLLRQSV